MKFLDGYKVYIGCIVAIAAIIAAHLGYDIPGVHVDDADWLNDIYYAVMVMAGRNAMPDKKGLT
jgi:hypothetical protein